MYKSAILSFVLVLLCAGLALGAPATQVNKIAAKVNGQIITMYDLQKRAIPELAQARVNPNDSAKTRPILEKTLDAMIMDILVQQEAKRLNISVSKRELDDEITLMMQGRGMTKEQFEKQLAQQKITPAELRKNTETRLLGQKVMGMEVRRRIVVRPEEIKEYYEAHKDTMYDRKGLHMGILVYHPKAPAKSVAAQIASGKMSFAQACSKYSIMPHATKGADMGPIEWDRLNPEFRNRLLALKPGETSPMFEIQKGFFAQVHLFSPDGAKELKRLSFEEAKPAIEEMVSQPKLASRYEEYTKQLLQKAIIEKFI